MPTLNYATSIAVGSAQATKAYLGTTQVWPSMPFVRSTSQAMSYGVSSFAVSKPAGAVEGDMLVGFITTSSENPDRTTPPSGWTLLDIFIRPGNAMSTFYKVVGPSEPASWTFSGSTSSDSIVHIVAVANADTTVAPRFQIEASDDHIAPSVEAFTSADLLLCAAGVLSGSGGITGGWMPPAGMTELLDAIYVDEGAYSAQTVASQLLTAPGQTGTRAFDSSGLSTSATAQVASVVVKSKLPL